MSNKEFYISLIGNVDAGKSTTIGSLTNPGLLDDGNGVLRKLVCKHPHERESGRTSDISQRHIVYPDRVLNFIDLCGHEKYLRTTINGLSSINCDLAIVCISDKITRMTKEHLGICLLTGIPILILFTKIDLVPPQITNSLIRELKSVLPSKRLIEIKKSQDISFCIKTENHIIPFIKTSNKSGNGMPFLSEFLQNIVKRHPKTTKNIFTIEHIYNITGYGTVLSGLLVGKYIKAGDTLYMGPFGRNREFIEVKVKTLHNDYKNFIDKLEGGYRGCICIRYDRKYSKYIKKGMILTQNPSEIITCKKFKAKVKIFHHQTTIQPGYEAFANIGTVSENVKIIAILNNENKNIELVRNGDEAYIVFEFACNYHYIEPGQFIIFREGSTKGIGQVTELL